MSRTEETKPVTIVDQMPGDYDARNPGAVFSKGLRLGLDAIQIMLASLLVLFTLTANAQVNERGNLRERSAPRASFDMEGVSVWFKGKFSEAELQTYRPEDFRIESQLCNCSDRPDPHYPYIFVIFSTPKGDLVGRPGRRGFDTIITRLAVRHGEQYCNVDAEDQCYGSFSNPCDFSDFQFESQLAPYFPTCKQPDADTDRDAKADTD